MNTIEINKQMQFEKYFKGTFPKNLLPIKKYKKPICFIINTDPSHKRGQHWVALYIDDNEAEYLDSYGIKTICCEIQKLLRKNKIKQLKYNKYHLQSITSDVCGAYCILYLKMRCNSFSFKNFLKLFSSNHTKNDLIVKNIIQK